MFSSNLQSGAREVLYSGIPTESSTLILIMSYNDTADLFGTGDTISECEDAEFLSASEAVKKLEEVI